MRTPIPQPRNQLATGNRNKQDDYKQRVLNENRVSIASGLSSSNRVKTVEGRPRNVTAASSTGYTPGHCPQKLSGIAKFDEEVRRAASGIKTMLSGGKTINTEKDADCVTYKVNAANLTEYGEANAVSNTKSSNVVSYTVQR